MKTEINGKPGVWSNAIWAKWAATESDRPEGTVVSANYFTPRPYRNEYDRGSDTEGFTYTIGRRVWQVVINKKVSNG